MPSCSIVFAVTHSVTVGDEGDMAEPSNEAGEPEPVAQPAAESPQQVTGHAEGVITGGGYSLDVDTVRAVIPKWQELVASYDNSLRNADVMRRVQGPGLDYASQSHAEAANRSGEAYYNYLVQCRDYCLAQVQILQDALNAYVGVDESSAEDIDKSDGGIL